MPQPFSPPPGSRRLLLTLSYTGTCFNGFQIQATGRTVQGELERAFARLCGVALRVHGAGRTDAGVHALAQTAHVDVPVREKSPHWRTALNALLPDDICVSDVREVASHVHARFSSLGKTYAYRLWHEREFVPPALRPFVWPVGELDTGAMLQTAARLTGTHDFAAFQNKGTEVSDTVRTLFALNRREKKNTAEYDSGHHAYFPQAVAHARPHLPESVWEFSGNGFLKQMVRNLMGLLVEVGRGKLCPDDAAAILAAAQRTGRVPTAPAQGLTLLRVYYPDLAGIPQTVPNAENSGSLAQ